MEVTALEPQKLTYLKEFHHMFLGRDILIQTLTVVQNHPEYVEGTEYTPGTILKRGDELVYIDSLNTPQFFHGDLDVSPLKVNTPFPLKMGDLPNVKRDIPATDVGTFISNALFLVYPFGDYLEYKNDTWNLKTVETKIALGILSNALPARESHDKYKDALHAIGSFSELVAPSITSHGLTTHPEYEKRKKELLTKYKGQLTDPTVAAKYEAELMALDKEYLGDDASTGFYDAIGGKAYNVHRKKMFLGVGSIEAFSDDVGDYVFIEESLAEGWGKNNFALICDEIRKGSYSRGKDTAKGGDIVNQIIRALSDIKIVEENCGSTGFVEYTVPVKDAILNLLYRTIITPNGPMTLEEEDVTKLSPGTVVKLRDPVKCKSKGGLCATCAGKLFEKLDRDDASAEVVNIGSTFVDLMMKNMHGTSVSIYEINPDDYMVA